MAGPLSEQLLNRLQDISKPRDVITLDGHSMTLAEVFFASEKPDVPVQVNPDSSALLQMNANYLQEKIKDGVKIYGVNTGFGGSANVRSDDVTEIQHSLIHHLNAGFGEKVSTNIVRGVMAIRANSLSRGFSGVRPDIVECLLKMLNEDIVPIVPKRGSISASGDLMPTSYIACCMMGRENAKVIHRGVQCTMKDLVQDGHFEPIQFQAKEALAVVNSAGFGYSLAANLLLDSASALMMTQSATALSVESLRGCVESFHPTTHKSMPHAGQIETAANIRHLLENSQLAEHRISVELVDREGVLKQDRYALRTSAQWLSPALETISRAIHTLEIQINSSDDNPLIDHTRKEILHGGNFQGISATVALDQTRQAIQLCGKLLFAQMSEMLNCKMSQGLTPNLCGSNPNVDFGFKGMDTAMASYMSELDFLTGPLTNHVLSAEMHNQSVNSLAFISARMTEQALLVLQMMLANITLAHVQAVDLRNLQVMVEKELSRIIKCHNIKADHVLQVCFPWYNFAFLPRETGAALMDFLGLNSQRKADLVNEMDKVMTPLVDDFVEGRKVDDVIRSLGDGTREVYSFVRKTLGIPFANGKRHLDEMLETIFGAIKDRKFNNVILKIFTKEQNSL